MSEWIKPIYDRTQSDIVFAISKIEEWRKTGATNVYELKGCLNLSDINRIEGNIQYLTEHLSELYYLPKTTSNRWWINGLPDTTEVSRIINNVREIISAYYQTSDAPPLPSTMLTYEQINSIEKNLYLIKNILDDMISSFRECGTFNCGEE